MALTILEYAKTQQNDLLRGVIETFAKTSPILQLLPMMNIDGNAFQYNQEDVLPGIAFRGINEGYTESTGLLNPLVEKLKIMGGDADTDLFLTKTQKSSAASRRQIDTAMKVKAAALGFTKSFFDGNESIYATEFDGLNQRIAGNQSIAAGDNGADLSENMLQRLIDAVDGKPTALLMGKKMRRQLFNLAKGSTILGVTQDAFGRQISTYADVPIFVIETDVNGATILDFDETQGSAVGTTGSIYAVRFEDMYISGIQAGPIDVRDLGEQDSKPVERVRIEWYCGFAVFHPKAAARLKGITAASGVL